MHASYDVAETQEKNNTPLERAVFFSSFDREHTIVDMYEHHASPLLHKKLFFRRMLFSFVSGATIILSSLTFGMLGYHFFEGMNWVDAFVNAAMILGGMGPFSPLKTDASKIFAGLYALYSGFALVTTIAVIFAPIAHRFLHAFHIDSSKSEM